MESCYSTLWFCVSPNIANNCRGSNVPHLLVLVEVVLKNVDKSALKHLRLVWQLISITPSKVHNKSSFLYLQHLHFCSTI